MGIVKVLVDHNEGESPHIHADLIFIHEDLAVIDVARANGYESLSVGNLRTNHVAVWQGLIRPADWWVNVHELFQSYGGPEEGGWWYTCGSLVEQIYCGDGPDGYKNAFRLSEELHRTSYKNTGNHTSVVYSGGDYSISITNEPSASFPTERPHYE